MATTTPNFGWPVPTSTDLVKDGATAIESLGDSIDASLLDLKGGTTGQVLSKNSNTDMDFTWVAQDDSNAIQNAIVDAKGDLIAATAADTPARLAVGTNGQVLTADSTEATGLKWVTAGGAGALALVTAQAIGSGVSSVTVTNAFSTTYDSYKVILINSTSSIASGNAIKIQLGAATTGYYYGGCFTSYNSTASGIGAANTDAWVAGALDNPYSSLEMELYQPYLALPTYFSANNTFTTGRGGRIDGCHTTATSYTDLKITPQGGTLTGGTLYVYGYTKV